MSQGDLDDIGLLLAQAREDQDALHEAETAVRVARERARQAWARYNAAADKAQLKIPLEEP